MIGALMSSPSAPFRSVFLCTLILGSVFVTINIAGLDVDQPDPGLPYVRLYDRPSDRLEVVVNQGDGQAFAALAQDPSLQRPEIFRAGNAEAAYRAQRPLVGWLAWVLSLGRPRLVPLVLVVLSILGYAALAGAVAWELWRRCAAPGWTLVVMVSPGARVTLDWTGPEALGAAFAVIGVALWMDDDRREAIAVLVAAGLCRESLLLVPIAIGLGQLLLDRRSWRSVAPLLLPLAVYAGWVAVVWARLRALPTDAGRGRLAVPVAGLLDASSGWSPTDLLMAATILLAGGCALAIAPRDPAAWVAGAFALASLVFGAEVWARLEDFSRVLLPLVAFSALALVTALNARRAGHAETEAAASP